MVSLIDVVEFLIHQKPGRTQRELAEAIFGSGGQPARIQYDCQALMREGSIVRVGRGGRDDPFRYFPDEDPGAPPEPSSDPAG